MAEEEVVTASDTAESEGEDDFADTVLTAACCESDGEFKGTKT